MLFSTESTPDTVDLSLLKCRERDQLEEVFKSWSCDIPCNREYLRTLTYSAVNLVKLLKLLKSGSNVQSCCCVQVGSGTPICLRLTKQSARYI